MKTQPKVNDERTFGYVNLLTNEWTDGIVAVGQKQCCRHQRYKEMDCFRWACRRPLIENMNTVLDDNKMLCLSNGQRINYSATFTMMFEVNDLAVASPATVSRWRYGLLGACTSRLKPIIDMGHSSKE